MFKIGVLASTKGTDLQAIIDEMKAGKMPGIELTVVLSNKKNAYALERAATQGYKALFVNPKGKTKEEYDLELAKILKEQGVQLVCLIGYMRILTPGFVKQFPRKIINVHPALIPKFSGPGFYGANVHEEVLKAKEQETGCTIHFVEEVVDAGEIIVQKKVAVSESDTPETLKEKVQALEKKWYPEAVRWLAEGRIK
jgi:phosphoribosylglycinamide formyltransferase-1